MRHSYRARCSLLVLAALPLSGCGASRPERMPVSGQVLIDGEPLTYGFVQVLPKDARPATGRIGPDGRFTLSTFEPNDGCVFGAHPVAVIANETLDGTTQRWHAPKRYADASTSRLTVQIVEGHPEITINLYWEGGKPFDEKFPTE